MLDDAGKALGQMLSPALRAVLWKSIGLALALIIVAAIALDRLILWLVGAGNVAVENGLGPHAHVPAAAIAWVLSVAAGLGHRRRQRVSDAGGHRFCGELLRRPDRGRNRTGILSGRSARGCAAAMARACRGRQDGFARGSGVRLRGGALDIRGLRRGGILSCDGVAAGTRYISIWQRSAFGRPARSRQYANATPGPFMSPDF